MCLILWNRYKLEKVLKRCNKVPSWSLEAEIWWHKVIAIFHMSNHVVKRELSWKTFFSCTCLTKLPITFARQTQIGWLFLQIEAKRWGKIMMSTTLLNAVFIREKRGWQFIAEHIPLLSTVVQYLAHNFWKKNETNVILFGDES